jgi:septal ring factor EnvC (AmiA/AmiB activator)
MQSAAIITALLALPILFSEPVRAQDSRRAETEARMSELNADISQLQSELESQRADQAREQDALRNLDLEIQENSRHLRSLTKEQAGHEAELRRLESERDEFLRQLAQNRDALGRQILAAWKIGRESRIKLILNQDSPARLSRTLAYYDFFSKAQAMRIESLKTTLTDLDQVGEEIRQELSDIAAIESRYLQTEEQLQLRRDQRLEILTELAASIGTDQARLEELNRDRADLEKVLQRLSDALADIPTDLGTRLHPGTQRGQLPMPVRGRVLRGYGQARGAGLHWQGWLIEAGRGSEIQAIAYGRVAYADWLRGYGLLMIIDHGDGFMSLYGNNYRHSGSTAR